MEEKSFRFISTSTPMKLCSWSMSDDGLKTGKSTKGKNKAGSKKELKPAQIEVELEEQVDNQKF